jgi:thiamine biosynthesis protein ThiS
MAELTITVNGESRGVPAHCTIEHLLDLLDVDRRRVAIERNHEVVPRATWPTAELADGDRLELVTFVGGGA